MDARTTSPPLDWSIGITLRIFPFAASITAASHGHIPLQYLHVQSAIKQRWAAGKGPLECEWSVILMKISGPLTMSINIETNKVAVCIEENHNLAVGHRGGGREGAASIVANPFRYVIFPEKFSVPSVEAHRQKHVPVGIDARQKNSVCLDDRCCPGRAG